MIRPGQIVQMTLYLQFRSEAGAGEQTYPIQRWYDNPTPAQRSLLQRWNEDSDKWKPVNGHKVRVTLIEILRRWQDAKITPAPAPDKKPINSLYVKESFVPLVPQSGRPSESPNKFLYFVDKAGFVIDENGRRILNANGQPITEPSEDSPPILSVPITLENGRPMVFLKGGPLVDKCVYFGLEPSDLSQFQVAQ